ncbi:CG13810, partial [Drosophila busckii]
VDTVWQRVKSLLQLPDLLVLSCLWQCGLSWGYYLKSAFVYDNIWPHWYGLAAALMALVLAIGWTLRKYFKQQYSYDHYYIIFYGLLCALLGSCFMLSRQLSISYYFSLSGMGVVYVASFSYVSLRSAASGLRAARLALGNACHAAGLACGFIIFNEFEPQHCGLLALSLQLLLLAFVCVNELLQHLAWHNYKQSKDLVFQLLNEERLVFLPRQSVLAQFVARSDYELRSNRQWWVLLPGGLVLLLQRCCLLHAPTQLQLMWTASLAFTQHSQLYMPYTLYAAGCGLGCLLLLRYTPKLVFLLFGIIQITLVVALLSIYHEDQPEHCFLFLCLIYASLGVLSSHALHWLLELSPFLYTELIFSLGFVLQLLVLEACKYELRIAVEWTALLISSVSFLLLTVVGIILVLWLQPRSTSLVDIRNRLLGIRRLHLPAAQTQFWHTNHFLAHDKPASELQSVQLDKSRVFQQYPISQHSATANGKAQKF